MAKQYSIYIKYLHQLTDLLIMNAALVVIVWAQGFSLLFNATDLFFYVIFANLLYLFLTFLLASYNYLRTTSYTKIIQDTLKLILLYILIFEATLNLLDIQEFVHPFRISFYLSLLLLIPVGRLSFIELLKAYRKSGFNYRKVIIVGYNEAAEELRLFFERHPEHGYRFLGYFDNEISDDRIKGNLGDIQNFVLENQVDQIYCLNSKLPTKAVNDLINFADNHLVRLRFIPDAKVFHYKNLEINFFDHLPVLTLRPMPLDNRLKLGLKRTFDILFSLTVIIFVLSWLIPILAILIKLESRGPVFYRQQRSGINNKTFNCLKFRTMYINSNSAQASKNDQRITKIGKFLRHTNLDEFPQFLNVLLGDMSIVGPRPHMLLHTEQYSKLVDKYMVRHFIRPGITGLSQIKGFRGETLNPLLMQTRVKQDIYYLENWSFLLDLKIILITIINMLKGEKNAY